MVARLIRFRSLAVAGLLALSTVGIAQAGCRADTVYLRGDWGQARFSVEVVDTTASRAQGLMNRAALPQSAGMLFVYDHPQAVSFWMKNTLIPLDMLFVDATGTVTGIHRNAIPHDLAPIAGGEGILAVLEINGGLAGLMGITDGSQMQHPVFTTQMAVWPCPE